MNWLKKGWVAFLLFFVVPILVVFWMMGALNPVTVETGSRGPYDYAYIVHSGDYSKIIDKQGEVFHRLEDQGIKAGMPIALLLNDPRSTAKKQLRSEAGYTIDPAAQPKEPLLKGHIPQRQAIVVRVKANPLLAPSKGYKALIAYLDEHHLPFNLPTVEMYHDGVLTIEMNL
jgi:effector-binding domain-containing protein